MRLLATHFLVLALVAPAGAQTVRPSDLRLEYHRAERAWRTGTNLYEAKVRLDRVLEALPGDGPAHLLRARVLIDLDRPDEALVDARMATTLMPDYGDAWLARAEAAQGLADGEAEARDALDRAAGIVTDGIDEHIRLSWVAQALGQLDRAEAFARIAIALGPSEPRAFWRLAEVFVDQGRSGDAATLVARGLDAGTLSPGALRAHPVLSPLADLPALRPYMER